ncbi:MAG TPA: helix-turn-helix transcriptional regulator [Hanamia sp.]|nr:helix-turn-helix transcriptional regulator [Hanamia sp.]
MNAVYEEDKKPGSKAPLTKREIEVLILICKEKSTKQIAATLDMSPHTVESHKKAIRFKIGSFTMVGMVVFAIQKNIFFLLVLAITIFYFFAASSCGGVFPDRLYD